MTQLLQSQYYTIGGINDLFYQKSYIDTVLFTKQNNTAFQTGLTTFPYTINDITYYAVSIDASYLDSKLSQYATTVSVNALILWYVSSSYLASNYQNKTDLTSMLSGYQTTTSLTQILQSQYYTVRWNQQSLLSKVLLDSSLNTINSILSTEQNNISLWYWAI
jgi:hypothetical protein